MSTKKFQYWPSDGQLGSTKFTMPTNAEDWPSGDALIGNFVYNEGKIVDFIDIKGLTPNTSKSTTIPYDYVNIELPFAEEAITINRGPRNKYLIIKFNNEEVEEGGNVIVTLKYKGCKTVKDVKAVDPNYKTTDIIDGVWSEGLGDLTNGDYMFPECQNLISFSSDLSSLTSGNSMFGGCYNLSSFSSNLSSLMSAMAMFQSCRQLNSFNSNLSSLANGGGMFHYCTNLTSFNSNLSSLTDGDGMFNMCKLDAPSVKNIIDTINTYSGVLTLGMGCNNTTEDKNLFAQEVGYTDMTSLLASFKSKGWTVTAAYTGRPTTTYGLRRPSEDTLPVFVKLEETEDYADYMTEDGSKKFRLDYFHETTGSTEGYTQFNSLEDAMTYWNVIPKENIITTEE